MDLILNDLQGLIYHKTQRTKQPTNQLASLQVPAAYALLSAREKKRVEAGQIIAASQQLTFSQSSEHLVNQGDHQRDSF